MLKNHSKMRGISFNIRHKSKPAPGRLKDLTLLIYASIFIASCGPAMIYPTQTPWVVTATPEFTKSQPTPCEGLCPEESAKATAAMALTISAMPTISPPKGATIIPSIGDLGWGAVYGIIVDGLTMQPLAGATVKCEHSAYITRYPCKGEVKTKNDGSYRFSNVYFHDTDWIILTITAKGYQDFQFTQNSFTQPEFHADFGLFPIAAALPSTFPVLMCTPPPCFDGTLSCGSPGGCPGGCGTVCLPLTPTP